MLPAPCLALLLLGSLTGTPQTDVSPCVVLDRQGRPVAGATLVCGETTAAVSDGDGTCATPQDCRALRVRAAGFLPWTGVPAPEIELTRPSSIRVRVVDAESLRPLVGAEVVARLPGSEDHVEPLARATVSKSGWTELTELPAGRYAVGAAAPGHRSSRREAAPAAESSDVLTFELVPTGTLTGMVRHGEQPMAGVRVLGRWGGWRGRDPTPPEEAVDFEVIADADGRFAAEGLPLRRRGPLTLIAIAGGGRWGLTTIARTRLDEDEPSMPLALIDLEARRELTGIVLDAEGQPARDALVIAGREGYRSELSDLFDGHDPTRTRTGDDGSFRLVLPPLERWVLQARAGERGNSMLERVDSTAEPLEGVELRLRRREPIEILIHSREGLPIEGALLRGRGVEVRSDAVGRITMPARERSLPVEITAEGYATWSGILSRYGRIRKMDVTLEPSGTLEGSASSTATGEPLTRFRVHPHRDVNGRMVRDAGLQRDVTTMDGVYRLEGLPAARWAVRIEADGYLPGLSETVDVVEGALAVVGDVSLAHGFTVEGRVVDAATGEGVVGARVSEADRSTTTGPDGRFSLDGLPPRDVALTARHRGYARQWSDRVSVDPATHGEVLIALARGGAVEGTLLRADGTPAERASVRADWADGGPLPFQSGTGLQASLRDGTFRFSNLPAGDLRISCWSGCRTSVEVSVVPGETVQVVLRDSAVHVHGRVWLDGQPYRRSASLVGSWPKQPFGWSRNSLYTFPSVPAGKWTVSTDYQARSGEWFKTETALAVPEGVADLPVDLYFESGAEDELVDVVGEVRDADSGALLPGVTVSCRHLTWPAEDGRFELKLPNGTHSVSGKKDGYEISRREVLVSEGELVSGPVVLEAKRRRGVVAFVRDASGQPIQEALCLLGGGGPWEGNWRGILAHVDGATDVRGRCTPEALSVGSHDLVALGPTGLVIRPDVVVPSDEAVVLELRQPGSLRIDGALAARLQEETTGHAWSWPLVRNAAAPLYPVIDADASRITVRNLQPGDYTVTVGEVGHRVEIAPGEETVLELR